MLTHYLVFLAETATIVLALLILAGGLIFLGLKGMTVTAALQAVEEASGVTLHGQHLLAARNQHHVTFAEPLADGDEVAFFPPVTRG